MEILSFISAGLGAIFLIAGIIGLFSARFRTILRGVPVANKVLDPMMWSVVFIVIGVVTGGAGYLSAMSGTASIFGTSDDGSLTVGTVGGLDLKIHDGLSNITTTEDYYNDAETELTLYSADANILDGEEYIFNITIERELISEDAVVTVSCSIPDKEIDGITADNIAEKTSGQIDLDINDGGKHSDDNTVYKRFAMAEGTGEVEVQVAFDQEETYHDGMGDLDDYVDTVCSVTADDGSSASVSARIYASS